MCVCVCFGQGMYAQVCLCVCAGVCVCCLRENVGVRSLVNASDCTCEHNYVLHD